MTRPLAAALAAIALGASCAQPNASEVTVFAAASLTDSFSEIATAFESESGVAVRLSFGPSDGLAVQVREGARADVFASASAQELEAVAASRGVVERRTFARNRLALIVPRRNEARIASLRDLSRSGVKLVVAASQVPAGRYARELLRRAGIAEAAMHNVVSNEDSVKGVVQKVILDEADAGIVYATDVTPAIAPRVRVIPIDDAVQITADYVIGVLRGAGDAARRFVAYLLGPGGEVLTRYGFALA